MQFNGFSADQRKAPKRKNFAVERIQKIFSPTLSDFSDEAKIPAKLNFSSEGLLSKAGTRVTWSSFFQSSVDPRFGWRVL